MSTTPELNKARSQSAALFAALQQGNNKLQEAYKPSISEYKQKYVEYPLHERALNIGSPNSSTLRLGDDRFTTNTWNSEKREKYVDHPFDAPIRPTPGKPYEASIRIGEEGGSASAWASEGHERYVPHPVDLTARPHEGKAYEASIRIGEDRATAADWNSEGHEKYVEYIFAAPVRPVAGKAYEASLRLGEEGATAADWRSEGAERYTAHDLDTTTRSLPSDSKLVRAKEGPIVLDGARMDASQWTSSYQDQCNVPPTADERSAGLHSGDKTANPMLFAWTGMSAPATASSEYASRYSVAAPSSGGPAASAKAAQVSESPLPNYVDETTAKWRSTYGDLCNGVDSASSQGPLRDPHPRAAQSTIALFATDEDAPKAVSEYSASYLAVQPEVPQETSRKSLFAPPMALYAQYANAADWRSSYQELCESGATTSESVTAGSRAMVREETPTFYAWSEGATDALKAATESEYTSHFKSAAVVPPAPASTASKSSVSPLPLYEEYGTSAKWMSTYKELCDSLDKPAPSLYSTAGAKALVKEEVPTNYAWRSPDVPGEGLKAISESRENFVSHSDAVLPETTRFGGAKESPIPLYPQFIKAKDWSSEYDDRFSLLSLVDATIAKAKAERVSTVHEPQPQPPAVDLTIPDTVAVDEAPMFIYADRSEPPSPAPVLSAPSISVAPQVKPAPLQRKGLTETTDSYRWPGTGAPKKLGSSSANKENKGYLSESSTYAWPDAAERTVIHRPNSTLCVQGSEISMPVNAAPQVPASAPSQFTLAAETPIKPSNLVFSKSDTLRSPLKQISESQPVSPVKPRLQPTPTQKVPSPVKSPEKTKRMFSSKKSKINPILYNRRYPSDGGRGRWASETSRSYTWTSAISA